MFETETVVRGPILTGAAGLIVDAMLSDFRQAVAQDALAEVQANLDASIRNPTPYYETQITNDRRSDYNVVHDRGIIYGPWLEGTSARNQTTRFKGYASFRRAKQTVERRIGRTVERTARTLARRLGG